MKRLTSSFEAVQRNSLVDKVLGTDDEYSNTDRLSVGKKDGGFDGVTIESGSEMTTMTLLIRELEGGRMSKTESLRRSQHNQ
jgi:hypothetical protein